MTFPPLATPSQKAEGPACPMMKSCSASSATDGVTRSLGLLEQHDGTMMEAMVMLSQCGGCE